LRIFLEYKAIQSGVKLVKVNPAYISFMCHQCNHIHPVRVNPTEVARVLNLGIGAALVIQI
jgi:transposase